MTNQVPVDQATDVARLQTFESAMWVLVSEYDSATARLMRA